VLASKKLSTAYVISYSQKCGEENPSVHTENTTKTNPALKTVLWGQVWSCWSSNHV